MLKTLFYLSWPVLTVVATCSLDQTSPPVNLTSCPNSSLFSVWRPRARFIAPEGWQKRPPGPVPTARRIVPCWLSVPPKSLHRKRNWGNISQCAAYSKDFVYWEDMNGWENPNTLWPSQIFDIRGVFDGSIMKNGYNGFPTTIYTGTFPSPLGSGTNEGVGAETQNIAYTEDDGASWIKLPFGTANNPIIWQWPMDSLTGFRDPYIFLSPTLSNLSGNSSGATGDHFLTISSGIHGIGPRLLLYRQTSNADVRAWTYLGPVISVSGPKFVLFRRLERQFRHQFRDSVGAMVNYTRSLPMGVSPLISTLSEPLIGGGAYATVPFSVEGNRSVLVGWAYEDDESLALAPQRSYQSSFTLFRDLFLKVIRNVDPNTPGLHSAGNWITRIESDGSLSVLSLGQRVVKEVTDEYRAKSVVSNPAPKTLTGSEGFVPFATQPTGRYYAIKATLTWNGSTIPGDMPIAGFRVLASDSEWTDIQFQPANETLIVDRSHNSLIASYGTETEVAKLRLWPILNGNTSTIQSLNLTIIVDNSALEVGVGNGSISYNQVELWDGLINAWPSRPLDTSKPLVNDGPLPEIWGGLWTGV
ncbi:glycosyl hydrolase [Mycena olivaceomarginata]|nr:glycosyl hydrolase [Mycena olivaceomarginata]